MKLWINRIDISDHTGYGRATNELTLALERADIHITPSAPTVINFCMPKHYVYHDYTVGYTPWESTNIPASWRDGLNRVDELWSTSKWSADVLSSHTGRNVWTLHHGLDDIWMPMMHRWNTNKPFTFLHVGEPAVRKGGDLVLEAWYKAFRDSRIHRLIYKTTGYPMARVKDRSGSIVFSPPMLTNGEVINKVYSDLEMWRLYCESDCLVYPTRGEGFGLIPLEAMASGLPTILPDGGGTGDFSKFGIPLTHYMWSNSGQLEHPGMWMDHDVDEIVEKMQSVWTYYNQYCGNAYEAARELKDIFNWDVIAEKLINRLDGHL